MLVKTFDQGWGEQWPLKQYEQQVVSDLVRPFVESRQRTVIINSVCYTKDMHEQVMSWLRERGFEPYTQDFGDISDLDLALPHNIPKFLAVLCEQTPAYWQKKFVDLQEKIQYNKAHFADYISQQQSIVKQGIPCPI